MTGTVKHLIASKGFGFIRDAKGVEYFFHREDFQGHWDDLVVDIDNNQMTVEVEFEPRETPKGARAANVMRLDFPNQAN